MYRIFLSLFITCCIYTLGYADVKAWEGTITLPTYSWEDDINPKFFALEKSIIYPYTMQDLVATEKEDRVYKALFLENEYLKVTCLPELAGRIFSVFDKTTGEEMFHKNPVVKPGMISMRGAWISGGIEWNTGPHSHSVTIVSPVNAALREDPDGSATLVVSNTEQIFRTRWTVYLTLGKNKLE